MVTSVGPGVDQVRLARVELDRWRDRAIADMQSGKPIHGAVFGVLNPLITLHLRMRLTEALLGCETTQEIEMVFSSIQDHQLCVGS